MLLRRRARSELRKLSTQLVLDLPDWDEWNWFEEVFDSIRSIRLVGPDLVLGKLFDEIGFNAVVEDTSELLRHLVIARLVAPGSKLKTVRYLKDYTERDYDTDQIYRHMDELHSRHKTRIEQISYEHSLGVLGGKMSVVFYDVTTLYFEADREDDLRKSGFSKEGKHKKPQILLGLLVSVDGYPLAYELFEGSKYEGHTMLPVIEAFKKKYQLEQLVVVADAGLMSSKNVDQLRLEGYGFILGARIKNESTLIKNKILNLDLKDGQNKVIKKDKQLRLIINYSKKRAAKDAYNRQRGLDRLEKNLAKGKLTKSHINKRGYNKYLKMQGDIQISIDYQKFEQDAAWDGLKGYLTNSKLPTKLLVNTYRELWKIERAFRIAKTDLGIRPIYHRVPKRIEIHICIAFMAYKVFKELERQLKLKKVHMSAERAIEILKTIQAVTIQHPKTGNFKNMMLIKTQQQQQLLQAFDIPLG